MFACANVSSIIAVTIFGMQLFGLSLFLEQSWQRSTITTGLAIAPGPAAVLIASFVAQKLKPAIPRRRGRCDRTGETRRRCGVSGGGLGCPAGG